jgi:hypothetical protein
LKGLDLAEKFFKDEIEKLIAAHFPKLTGKYAAGLIGPGSDVLEYDDELSRDHDWGPRCQIWLSEFAYRKYTKGLNQLFNEKLPRVFLGFRTGFLMDNSIQAFVPAKLEDEGVFLITITTVNRYLKDQYGLYTGSPGLLDWLYISEQKLLELTRGRIFYDPVGDITRIRKNLAYFPKNIRYYKLLNLWEGLDNHFDIVNRCILRKDILSARIMIDRIVELMVRLIFLLNRRYCPATLKWFSREFYSLPHFANEIGPQLEEAMVSSDVKRSYQIVESITLSLIKEVNRIEFGDDLNFDFNLSAKPVNYLLKSIARIIRDRLPLEFQNLVTQRVNKYWITNDITLPGVEQNNNRKGVHKIHRFA